MKQGKILGWIQMGPAIPSTKVSIKKVVEEEVCSPTEEVEISRSTKEDLGLKSKGEETTNILRLE